MLNDDFNNILQALKNGQNPTSSSGNSSGLITSQRNEVSGTNKVQFGLRPVNENAGADGSGNSTDND